MKRLILISFGGSFVEWGAGMVVAIGASAAEETAGKLWFLTVQVPTGVFILAEFTTEQKAKGARGQWLQAIINAPDGGLLRWDYERECVTDELAPDDEVFAEEVAA